MVRRLLIGLAVAVVTVLPAVWAQEATKSSDAIKDDAALRQEILGRQYRDFSQNLLRLAQRLERSGKAEDREKAVVLMKAIELASKEGIDTRFDKLIGILKTSKASSLQEVQDAVKEGEALAQDLRAMLAILLTDNRDAQLKAEKDRLTNLLKHFDRVIREQKNELARNENGRAEGKDLAKSQGKVTRDTQDLAKAMGGKGSPAAENKGAPKDGGKGQEGKGQGKDDTKEKKGGIKELNKPGKKDESGDKKDPGKDGAKGQGDKKGGEKGQPGAKAGPKDQQASKSGKPGDSKGKSDGKGEGKPGQKGDSQAQAKGQPGQSGQQGQKKGEQNPGNPSPSPQQQQEQQQTAQARRQVEDATQDQKKAEGNLKKEDREVASKNQSDAIDKLEKARKQLEELLKQLREEELERLLAALKARCERMLQMQIEVYDGTVRVAKAVGDNTDKKPTRANEQRALQLSDREGEIVREANKAIAILEAEGSAVAFAEVFLQVRGDMVRVQQRLGKADVGPVTQVTEQDIIATLKEMIEALEKARRDNENRRNNPPPPGQPGPPPPQRLLDIIAELKMIRSMQLRINNRTTVYAKQYQGEQADAPDIQKELQNLADRQVKIFEVTKNIATGKNQ